MTVRIITGDCREVLATLPAESVHCVVTSPPYWGLRDYGVEGQIGLESDFSAYVGEFVAVFRQVRRVLRSDGTLWLNLGDSYAGSWGAKSRDHAGKHAPNVSALSTNQVKAAQRRQSHTGSIPPGSILKPKDLVGIPWRCAFALQADGWWLRQDIIWSKPNPMPESVTDRCTKAHEYLFLLSKSERYWFDQAAIAEVSITNDQRRPYGSPGANALDPRGKQGEGKLRTGKAATSPRNDGNTWNECAGRGFIPKDEYRNKRSVWSVATEAFPKAHFATFPPALIEPCILAGCPKGGTVLDPFGGAGTTGLVADRLGRDAILIELNPTYAEMAKRRINADAGPLLAPVAA